MVIAYNPAYSITNYPAYNPAGYGGGGGPFTPLSLSPSGWYSARNASNYAAPAYGNITQTGSGFSGFHAINTSAAVDTSLPTAGLGMKIRIDGTDIFTDSSISGSVITTVEVLTNTYLSGRPLAVQQVPQLTDLSGNNNHATSATGLIYVPSGINSKAAWWGGRTRFANAMFFTNQIVFTGAYTLYFVLTYYASSAGAGITGKANNSTSSSFFRVQSSGQLSTSFHDNSTATTTLGVVITTGTPMILAFQYDGTDHKYAINNGAWVTVSDNGSGNSTFAALGIGSSTTSAAYSGPIGEALYIGSATNTSQHTNVLTYLNSYWGIY
jgi:hypothetical protein